MAPALDTVEQDQQVAASAMPHAPCSGTAVQTWTQSAKLAVTDALTYFKHKKYLLAFVQTT
jgi:hypothetical protein